MFALKVRTSSKNYNSGGAVATGTPFDPYWSNVVALLSADGANAANNNTFVDASPNNLTISALGSPIPAASASSPFNSGWSANFNGTNMAVATASLAAFNLGSGSDFTVEAFILPRTISAAQTFFQTSSNSNLTITTSGTITYSIGGTVRITSATTLIANSWAHVALVKNGATTTLFINGVNAGTTTINPTNAAAALYIGASYTGGWNQWFNGFISNLRIISGTAAYTANFTPPTANLPVVTNTVFLTFRDSLISDVGPNNITITAGGVNVSTAVICTALAVNPFSQWNTNYWSAEFNGSTDRLTAPASSLYSLGTNDFTIECFVSLSAVAGPHPIVSNNYTAGTGQARGPFLLYSSAAGITFYSSSNGTSWDIANGVTIKTGAVAGTWYHIAVTRQGSTFRTFANGALVSTFTSSASLYSAPLKSLNIGADDGLTEFFSGLISNVRIINGTALYTSAFTPSTAPLQVVPNTVFLSCQNSTFIDNSVNAFSLAVNGAPIPYNIGPFSNNSGTPVYSTAAYGASTYFNGSNSLSVALNSVFGMGTGDFTLEAWVFSPTLSTASAAIISLRTSAAITTQANILAVGFGGAGKLCWSNGAAWSAGTTVMANNTWYHVAVSRQGSTVRLFVNGKLDLTITDNTDFGASRPVMIGSLENTSSFFTGSISNVRINKGTAIYTQAFTPATVPLSTVAGTSLLLTNSNVPVFDSAYKSPITTLGSTPAQLSTATTKFGASSIKLSGTSGSSVVSLTDQYGALLLGTNNFTIECWVNLSSLTNQGTLFFINGNTASYAAVRVDINTSNKVILLLSGNGSTWGTNLTSTASISTGAWHHVAVVRSGSSIAVYLDGTSIISTSITTTYGGPVNYLGLCTSSSFYLNGYIDDFRFTNGVARYSAAFTPPTAAFPNHG